MRFALQTCLVMAMSGAALAAPTMVANVPLEVSAYFRESGSDLDKLQNAEASQMRALAAFDRAYQSYQQRMDALIKSADGGGQGGLLEATRQMQETQMSFNLQYLQLQNSMQNDNRQFTMVSNIMKTKHDTAKNSIRNVR